MKKVLSKPLSWWLQTPLYAMRHAARITRQSPEKIKPVYFKILRFVNLLSYKLRPSSVVLYNSTAPLRSGLCNQAQIDSEAFKSWTEKRGSGARVSRKDWELSYICQALYERGFLAPGKRGLVLAVGTEELPSLFASMGCEIVASDMASDKAAEIGWIETNQHAASLESLNTKGLCPSDVFAERVTFRVVDMNHIPDDLMQEKFDFVWSACSLEHLGSIQKGQEFILNSMRCLKPGGVAVHTTEFNLSSNWLTVNSFPTCIFRRRDIEQVVKKLRKSGYSISIDYKAERLPGANYVDVPHHMKAYNKDYLCLVLENFVTTSVGLIIDKPKN